MHASKYVYMYVCMNVWVLMLSKEEIQLSFELT